MTHKKQIFEPLAIVGMSCLFPKSQSLENYWETIKEKVDAITEVPETHWQSDEFYNTDKKAPDKVYTKTGGFIDPVDFNPAEWGIAPSDLDSIDTSQLLSLVVAQAALNDAGYTAGREYNRDNVSVILGLTGTLELVIPLGARLGHPIWKKAMQHAGIPDHITDEVMSNIGKAYVSWQENSFPGLLGNVAAGRIANRFNLGGTNCVVDAACGSALGALNLAAMELWTGKTDMAITGGIDTFNDIFMYMCFCKTPALSPTGQARPFSEDNDGTILGEGIGMFVLKRLSDAEKDNDKIYALVNAIGTSSDGKGKAIYAPSPAGQTKALKRAYEQAGISPKEISLVEAHGTGTGAGDEVEVNALKEVYGTSETGRPWCAIGSVKSQIGHTKAAAGSAGILKAALALYHKVIPPTIKISRPAKALCSENVPFYLPDRIRPWVGENDTVRHAAVSSLGFGGSNYHVVLSEYKPDKLEYDWPASIEIATISGKTTGQIKTELQAAKSAKTATDKRSWAARTRQSFNANDKYRLTFTFTSQNDDLEKMATDLEGRINDTASSFALPTGAYFYCKKQAGPVGVIFPGQGSQYCFMGLETNCFAPEAFSVLKQADSQLGKIDEQGNRLIDYIYPIPTYDAELDARAEERLRATEIAQPAIGTIALGQYRLLEKLGVKAQAFAGHSYGELVSLCAAGAFSCADLAEISRKRGELMNQGTGDKGGMIAIAAERGKVEEVIKAEKLDLVVANHNSPKQVVLSGKTAEIERSQKIFKAKKMRATILKVAGAFHSSFVSDAAEPFYEFLKKKNFAKLQTKVYANTTASPYPDKDAEVKKLLGHQLANQVRFVEIIEKMYEDGIRTFIEVGPGGKMVGLIKSILDKKDVSIIAIDSSAGKRSGVMDTARVIAQLVAQGYEIDCSFWQNGETWLEAQATKPKPRLTFPVCGANYKSPALRKHREELNKPAKAPLKLVIETTNQSQPATAVSTPTFAAPTPGNAAPAPAMPTNNQATSESVRLARETLGVLQSLQQQTADLHRRFLEGQEQAQNTILSLINNSPMANSQPRQTVSAGGFQPAYQPAEQPATPSVAQAVSQPEVPAFSANVPATTAPAAQRQPAEPAEPAAPSGNVSQILLEVVGEKTGYPSDMLNLEMDMEADLGIDSIKRVEIMSAMQEKLPEAPVIQPDQLGKLRTLSQIIDHLGQGQSASATEATATQSAGPDITPVLLEVVGEKTGYPSDMLNLEMDMEADLGIDSIKRVEIMSAMQEKLPEAPVIQPDQLGKLRTLGQILEFLSARATTGETSAAATTPSLSADKIAETLIEVIAEKTGYPVDMLNPEMDMEADLGIDSIKRVEILSAFQEKEPDAPIVQPGDLGKFRTISQILDFLSAGNNEQPTEQTPVSEVKTPTADTEIPTTGRENLAELQRSVLVCEELSGNPEGERVLNEKDLVLVADDGSDFSKALAHEFAEKGCNTEVLSLPDIIAGKFSKAIKALVLTAPVPVRDKDGLWSEAAEEWLKDAFLATREAGMAIKTNGKGLIATVSRLDGAFGLTNPTKTIDPVQGGLAGLSKTIAHEWPELQSRAIDLDYRFKDAKASARKLVEELMYAGPQETGLTKSGRFTLKTKEIAVKEEHNAAATFTNDDLILATGGARGVTAATAIAFAKKFKAGMVLLGRSAAPADEPEWLAPLTAEAEIKGAILKNSEKKLTPKELEAGFKKHMANREILQTLKQIKDCGARVWYYSADLRSEKEVSEVIASVQKDGGNIRGLIHGAGVLRDRKIEDKTREQLDDVIDTKVKGLRIVLKALKKADLKAIVLFSSFSGRFGRSGQVDYAMANEVLNKAAHKLKILRPDCKVLSFNWGPWDGGMVTPNLRNLFIAEGTGLIDVQAGAWQPIVELSRENDALEICIIGARGQTHPQEGSGPKKLLKAFDYELKLDTNAWLKSHVINGDAVLPMAVTAEMLIHLATMKNPELKFVGYDDLRVLKGIVLKEGKRKISFYSTEPTKDGNNYKIATEIRSNHNGKEIVNAKATILLSDSYNLSAPAPLNVDSHLVYPDSINEIYSNKLFHGEFFQALTKVAGWSEKGITALANTALPPGNWSNDSLCPRWYSDPLAIDAAFQLMILWSIQTTGAPSLPTFAQKYRQYCNHFPEQVTIRASAKRNTDHSAIADIDFLDSNGQVLARMNGYECTINEALKQAFKSRTVVGA